MPGAVYNEDYTIIDVTKGVYVAHPMLVPDGYAYELENFVVRDGIVQQRMPIGIITDDDLSSVNQWFAPGTQLNTVYEINLPIASQNFLAGFVDTTHTPRPYLVGYISVNGVGKIQPAATLSGSLCVYNGTLYAGATSGVIKIGLTNFPTSITETAIASSPTSLYKIITHKSRLFGTKISGNRLYFTDAPSVGNLPETWNSTVNFIDFNGPSGTTNITDLVSLNNYIYVFTDNGLFSLYTSGAPSNWVVRLVNPDISVGFNQVVVKDNLIYYSSESGVYVTDGFDFKLISQALTEYFTGINQTSPSNTYLTPFDGGLLLRVRHPLDGSYGSNIGQHFYTKTNEIAWTKITFSDINVVDSAPVGEIAIRSVEVPNVFLGFGTVTYFTVTWSNVPNTTNRSFLYIVQSPQSLASVANPDFHLALSGDTVTGFATKNIILRLTTKELTGSNFMRMKQFRDLVMVFGTELPFSMVVEAWYDGKNYAAPTLLPDQDAPSSNVLTPHSTIMQSIVKAGLLNQLAMSVRLRLTITLLQSVSYASNFDRYYFNLAALGYTSRLERTIPGNQAAGLF